MKRQSAWKFLLIISLAIAYCTANNFLFTELIGYIIFSFWILVALVNLICNNFKVKNKENQKIISVFIKYQFGSRVIIFVYTIILIAAQLTEQRFLSSNILTFVNGLTAVAIFYLFGEYAFQCNLLSVLLSYIILLTYSIVVYKSDFHLHLEFHDLAFATGYLIIYYFLYNFRITKQNIWHIILLVILTILAFKRIELVALACAWLIKLIIDKIPGEKLKEKFISFSSWIFIFCCFLYIWFVLVFSDVFFDFININWMGRNYYFKVCQSISEFSLKFIGIGRNAMQVIFTEDYSYFNVGNIHSDILRMYVECGFVLFFLWLLCFIVLLPRAVGNKFGYKCKEFLYICTIYTFIVYSTDNTELYLLTQYMYILVPMLFIKQKLYGGCNDFNFIRIRKHNKS